MTSSRKFSAVFATGFICLLELHSLAASASSCDEDAARELSRKIRLNGDLGYFQEAVLGEPLPSITKVFENEVGIGDLPRITLVNILRLLDPKSLAECRIVCGNFYGTTFSIEAVRVKHACIGCQFAQDWLLMACGQGSRCALRWLHSRALAYGKEDSVATEIVNKAFAYGKYHAILMLVDIKGDEGINKLKFLLKNQSLAKKRLAALTLRVGER